MPWLTVNLNSYDDVRFAIAQLTLIQRDLLIDPEVREPHLTRADILDLLATKTGRMLIKPFLDHVPPGETRTIEQLAALLKGVSPGTDLNRKAHSLIAGLGRWERNHHVSVFHSTGTRPASYQLNPIVRHLLETTLASTS